jgi:probable HAF family extracellular repeat protein
VAGYSETFFGAVRAFLHTPGGPMIDLGGLPGYVFSYARDLNDAGDVVGYVYDRIHSVYQAFVYSGGVMTGLGKLPGTLSSQAFGINNSGWIVGWSGSAFLYKDGLMINLQSLLPADTPWRLHEAWEISDAGTSREWAASMASSTHICWT